MAKKLKTVKQVAKALLSLQKQVEELVEKREDVFNERSESWQDSEKGEYYCDLTERLEELVNQLCCDADELEGW